jgi:hypothetical protein
VVMSAHHIAPDAPLDRTPPIHPEGTSKGAQ